MPGKLVWGHVCFTTAGGRGRGEPGSQALWGLKFRGGRVQGSGLAGTLRWLRDRVREAPLLLLLAPELTEGLTPRVVRPSWRRGGHRPVALPLLPSWLEHGPSHLQPGVWEVTKPPLFPQPSTSSTSSHPLLDVQMYGTLWHPVVLEKRSLVQLQMFYWLK